MGKPSDTLWRLEPHTRTKHLILRRYLEAWLSIMARTSARHARSGREQLVLVDGFAGPGRYLDGEPGSPLLMIDAFLEHTQRAAIGAQLVYLLIEERADRAAHLGKEIGRLDLPDQVSVMVLHDRFETAFPREMASITQAGRRPPTFAFIDPFGYADTRMRLAGRFLQFARCEALIYVPLPHVRRFLNRAGQAPALDSLFGSDRWREAIPLRGAARLDFLHHLFVEGLQRYGGLAHVRSFEIATSAGNGYYLFFGTHHIRGLEKIVEVMWEADPIGGERLRREALPGQLPLALDTTPLLEAMRRHFGRREFSIEEAHRFTLLRTPYAASHIKKMTLAPAERAGELLVTSSRSRRFTFPDGTRMTFVH